MKETKKPMKTDIAANTNPIFATINIILKLPFVRTFSMFLLRMPPRMKRMTPDT